jgi:phosphatidylserine/phosphatidylglycerophosphate/cardiolipin synthase-like enzyme
LTRQRRRLSRSLLLSAVILAVLPIATAIAEQPERAERQSSATPHLDAVEQTLRKVSPGLEGTVWQRTTGNSLDASGADPADWLLQTPGCWGDATCADRAGTRQLLAKMTQNVAKATSTVDISTLAPLPDGAFQDAIVAGLKAAAAAGRKLRVRILVGAVPIGNLNVVPAHYRDALNRKLGPAAANVTFNIASMTTSKTAFSWNHSKILLVDGKSAIVGGINNWHDAYIGNTNPVSDIGLALAGPAASSAGRYLDTLWAWTCQNKWDIGKVWFASSNGSACIPALTSSTPVAATGNVPVIAVGSLGVGIKNVDPSSTHQPTLPTAPDSKCTGGLRDNTNANRDFDTVNPEESALRSLVASATRQVEISQQDLNGLCPPLPRYDIRLYDILAAKLAAGVKVRIVLSDPANRGKFGSGGYSAIKSLAEVSDVIRNRLALLTGDQAGARTKMCRNLQLASFQHSASARWADGRPYALHHKLIVVDRSTFYIGSKNLYPAWLQDFGYIVEDRTGAAQIKTNMLDPEWKYSQTTATVDFKRGICPA